MTDPIRYKLGKKPARPGAVKMLLRAYLKPSLPMSPAEFGHDGLVSQFHMLGNDQFGCCFWSGAAHEEYVWSAATGQRVRITTADVLEDYGSTGFKQADPNTDQGTDMQAGAKYRQDTGILDALGRRHKIGAYAAIKAGDIEEHKTATWLFGAVGVGLTVGDNQQDQFAAGKPWDGPPGPNAGGHYCPIVAFRGGNFWVITWGKLQAMTPAFLSVQNDESVAYLSADYLIGGKSLEGFDVAALGDDLKQLTS